MGLQTRNAAYQKHIELKIAETIKECQHLREDNEALKAERDRLLKA